MTGLSILIPTFNGICKELVSELQKQVAMLPMDYEVIVADDGSTSQATITENRGINSIPHCQYMECQKNRGRAVIRNFLVQQAQYEWLLFIDSDMTVCRHDFISRYVACTGHDVVYGGVSIGGDAKALRGNLRYKYEKKEECQHTAIMRQQAPYQDFHTANFMIRRELMLACPFDESIRQYGYEDVLLGKRLEQKGIAICHIDNPLSFQVFEDNADFVSKTEEGLRTLHTLRDRLKGYSRMIDFAERHQRLLPLIRLHHQLWGTLERRLLTGSHPSLAIFKLYKAGYYLSLSKQDNMMHNIQQQKTTKYRA